MANNTIIKLTVLLSNDCNEEPIEQEVIDKFTKLLVKYQQSNYNFQDFSMIVRKATDDEQMIINMM